MPHRERSQMYLSVSIETENRPNQSSVSCRRNCTVGRRRPGGSRTAKVDYQRPTVQYLYSVYKEDKYEYDKKQSQINDVFLPNLEFKNEKEANK